MQALVILRGVMSGRGTLAAHHLAVPALSLNHPLQLRQHVILDAAELGE
jgi:hypothetical protein